MDFLVAVLVLGVGEVVILTVAFRAFERSEEKRARAELSGVARTDVAPGRFFADARDMPPTERASLDAIVLQLEHHVRLEQAAAESFLHNPTTESLHYRAAPPPSRLAS